MGEIEHMQPKLNLMGQPMDRRLYGAGGTTWTGSLGFKGIFGSNPLTKYWSYHGSFTTPPCTEAVDFYIMQTPATMSMAQLNKFKTNIGWTNAGGNFRPPQKLGSRIVEGCSQVANMENMLAAHSASLSKSIEDAVAEKVQHHVELALEEQQGGHGAMLTALIVLASLIMVGFFSMLGLLLKVLKMPLPPPQSKGPAAEQVGAGERQEV